MSDERHRIVSVRGTMGSGKSTIVRSYLHSHDYYPLFVPGRRLPYGYLTSGITPTFVVGHYETPAMGGSDSFVKLTSVYEAIGLYAPTYDVLYEGKAQNADVSRLIELRKTHDVQVIFLDTTVDEAEASVRNRASACDIRRSLIEQVCRKMDRERRTFESYESESLRVYHLSRADARDKVRELLG